MSTAENITQLKNNTILIWRTIWSPWPLFCLPLSILFRRNFRLWRILFWPFFVSVIFEQKIFPLWESSQIIPICFAFKKGLSWFNPFSPLLTLFEKRFFWIFKAAEKWRRQLENKISNKNVLQLDSLPFWFSSLLLCFDLFIQGLWRFVGLIPAKVQGSAQSGSTNWIH